MRSDVHKHWLSAVAVVTAFVAFCDGTENVPCPVSENLSGRENIEWSIGYGFHLTDAKKDLPRVLLVGDSICNGYQGGVQRLLEGKANVTYWISSYCVTSPRYRKLLGFYLDDAQYEVIHLNNGLHSLDTDGKAWGNALYETLLFIRTRQPKARIIWATSTPTCDSAKTEKVRALNARAARIVEAVGGISTDDLFALCDPLDRGKNWRDKVHFKSGAANRQAQQVSEALLKALPRPPAGALAAKIAEKHKVLSTDLWFGGLRTVFDFDGYEAWVVEPPPGTPAAEDRPWTWTMQWKDAFVPRTGVPLLLAQGFHHVTIDTFRNHMDEKGLSVSRKFQDYLVRELGLAPKARLIGMSWGGFFSVRYASACPENVERIYLDAPLLNFDGFRAVPQRWKPRCPKTGGWTESSEMPVNRAEPIAKAGIPILLLYGGKDTVVPPDRNCELFVPRFRAAGGEITVVKRDAFGHHPHGLDVGDATVVDFMRKGLK